MDKLKEKYDLIKEAAIDGFPLLYLDKFKKLQSKYPKDKDIQNACATWSAVIHEENNQLNEALEILLQLIENESLTDFEYSNALYNTLKLLVKLDRVDDARNIFDKHIFSEKLLGHSFNLHIILWYIDTLDPAEQEVMRFKPYLEKAKAEYGISPEGVEIKDQIKQLHIAYQNLSVRLSRAKMIKGPIEERIQGIKNFISTNPPAYFKNIAEKIISQLQERK